MQFFCILRLQSLILIRRKEYQFTYVVKFFCIICSLLQEKKK